jgi:hypothetical protein
MRLVDSWMSVDLLFEKTKVGGWVQTHAANIEYKKICEGGRSMPTLCEGARARAQNDRQSLLHTPLHGLSRRFSLSIAFNSAMYYLSCQMRLGEGDV